MGGFVQPLEIVNGANPYYVVVKLKSRVIATKGERLGKYDFILFYFFTTRNEEEEAIKTKKKEQL